MDFTVYNFGGTLLTVASRTMLIPFLFKRRIIAAFFLMVFSTNAMNQPSVSREDWSAVLAGDGMPDRVQPDIKAVQKKHTDLFHGDYIAWDAPHLYINNKHLASNLVSLIREKQRLIMEEWDACLAATDKSGTLLNGGVWVNQKYRELSCSEYNLVWHVMKKMPAYSNNKELASFIMAVSGTLISRKEGDRFKLRFIKPKVNQKEFIAACLKGGRTSQLVCNEKERCLVPRLMPVTILNDPQGGHLGQSSNPCMKSKVYRKVMDIRTKYMAHEEFTSDEIDFLDDAVNLPVYRYIQVSAAAGTPFLIQDAIEFIAANILLTQFDRVMSELIEAICGLQKIYPEEFAIEQFKESLRSAHACVHECLFVASSGSIHEFTQRLQNLEQTILSKTN